MSGTPRHFLDLKDFDGATLRLILDTARLWRDARGGRPKGAVDDGAPLAGRALAMIFEKASTRTRISFDMAMRQLGGTSLVLESGAMQLGRGETVADTARVMSRYVDVIMIRANVHSMVEELAAHAGVPVINGLTDRSHPCQLMADMMTFEDHRGPIAGRRVAWVGDGNNVAVSLIEAAVRLDFALTMACPPALAPPDGVMQWAQSQGGSVTLTDDPAAAVAGVDAVFTDTWVSMGDARDSARLQALAPFQVDKALMNRAAADVIFMHCLPAHRGEEVTDDVIDGPGSVVWDEAENRLHAQKAVLAWCLGAIG